MMGSNQSTVPERPVVDPIRVEIAVVELEMAGFSPEQAHRLVFLGWLNEHRDIEHIGVEVEW